MSEEIKQLEPKALWNNFYKLTQIPRPSKHEQEVAEFIKNFGQELNLETQQDEAGNILVRKPATKGMEDRKTVILQGHVDMVPQKNNDVDHDFTTDPIEAYVNGEFVTAKGTTLGADNGMGVAAGLTILESKDITHGPLEVLFTMDEETGMTGVFGLKKDFLKGDILINMDSEDEGELYIGCAGGMDTMAEFNYEKTDIPNDVKAYEVIAKGLKGGHTGLDIHLGRANAIKIINRCIWDATRKFGVKLATFNSGDVRNAIPREGSAVVVVPNDKTSDFEKYVKEYNDLVKNEYRAVDPDSEIYVQPADMPKEIMDDKSQNSVLNAIYGIPNGVISWLPDMPEVVETSTSTGIIKTEDGKVSVVSLQRSSVDTRKEDLGNMIRAIFEEAGAKVEHHGSYPGWNPDVNSPILATMKEVYNKNFGKVPEVKVIHAGLECGLIKAFYPNLDAISFGPSISFPHSPDEKVNIETVNKFWKFLKHTLENIPKK